MAKDPYEDLDIGYFEMPLPNTEEFTAIRFLTKTGVARLWNKIKDKFIKMPSGGTSGQALVKTDSGVQWHDVLTEMPEIPDPEIPTLPEMTGILPVTKGGTGCTTIDGIRTMLFNFPTEQEIQEYLGQDS